MNNTGKTETADPTLWKHNHIKAFSTHAPKEQRHPCMARQMIQETTTCIRGSRKKRKILTFGMESFLPLPLCEFTAFQRAHNGLLGKHYSGVGGRQLFRACSVSSLHVPLLDVNNRIGQLQSLPSVNGKQLECIVEVAVAKCSPSVFFSSHDCSTPS